MSKLCGGCFDIRRSLDLDGSRSAGNVFIELSEGTGVSPSNLPTRGDSEDVPSAEFVAKPGIFVLTDCVSVDENMLDVYFLEESSQALAVDEMQSAGIVLEGVANNWSHYHNCGTSVVALE